MRFDYANSVIHSIEALLYAAGSVIVQVQKIVGYVV
jgi:hypothetical protein